MANIYTTTTIMKWELCPGYLKFDSLSPSILIVFCLLVNICTKCKPVENPTSWATRQALLDQFSPLEVSGEVILTGTVACKVISQEYNRCICRVCELHVFSYWETIMKPWKLKDKYWYQAAWKNLPSVVALTWKQTWGKHCMTASRLRLQWRLHKHPDGKCIHTG